MMNRVKLVPVATGWYVKGDVNFFELARSWESKNDARRTDQPGTNLQIR